MYMHMHMHMFQQYISTVHGTASEAQRERLFRPTAGPFDAHFKRLTSPADVEDWLSEPGTFDLHPDVALEGDYALWNVLRVQLRLPMSHAKRVQRLKPREQFALHTALPRLAEPA